MADLTRDDILKLAQLARLKLTNAEIAEYSVELSALLRYVEQLQLIDIEGLLPTNQLTGLTNADRPDEIKDYGYDPHELLKNVPHQQNNQIKVKRMVG